MGFIAKLRAFTRTATKGNDVKIDSGGGPLVTAKHFSAPGDDSHPLAGDYVHATSVTQSGRAAVSGYLDPNNRHKAQPGDKRIYGRNADGVQVSEVWLKNDGSIAITSTANIDINGVTITPAGAVIIPASLVLAGKEIAGHSHPQAADSAGDTQENTGPNL